MIVKERGVVTRLFEEVTGTSKAGNAYNVREFVVEVNDEGYKNLIHLKAMGSNVRALDGAAIGDTIEVTYKPSSHEHNGRWYDDLRLLGVTLTRGQAAGNEEDKSNDLPF